ncbi:hypothetical protein SLEP1_g12056 [Rubroshorea leprosula]|nr:hypothetical protein SLEP1_g12056 [Rubroshorea leprosula]
MLEALSLTLSICIGCALSEAMVIIWLLYGSPAYPTALEIVSFAP